MPMTLTKIELENITVFDSLSIGLTRGINIFIGENGTGKTHLLKLLYSACQAAQVKKTGIGFGVKIARTFKPDELSLHRIARRNGRGNKKATIKVYSDEQCLCLTFDAKNIKNTEITGDEAWSRQFSDIASTFIPAKEILSHAKNLIQAIEKGNVDFDDTYKDIVSAASVNIADKETDNTMNCLLEKLPKIINGTVTIYNDEFYLLRDNQSTLEFQLVAEGLRKIALLWQLIKNGVFRSGSLLLWDEPEANINPVQIPAVVDILLELQRNGVQIFLATHNYFFAKYLEVRRKQHDDILFHAFHKSNGDSGKIQYCFDVSFDLLEHNSILTQSIELYKEEVKKVME
jgi:predicted ATP-dependent endonuclease of OLD family